MGPGMSEKSDVQRKVDLYLINRHRSVIAIMERDIDSAPDKKMARWAIDGLRQELRSLEDDYLRDYGETPGGEA